MNKNIKNLFAIVIISLFAFSIISEAMVSNANAATPKSTNVALVPGPDGQAENGGTLPTSGFPNGDTFTFTNLSPDTIMTATTDPLSAYDTVVFVQLFISGNSGSSTNYWADSTFSSRITNFVSNGGKLIIYDSEIQTNNYANFIYPFNSSNPGANGAEGYTWIVESNSLGSNSTSSSTYLSAPTLCAPNDAETGDSNVMTSFNSNWHVHMVCTNVNGITGPVHTYAEYGKGLIIFNGLDMDPMSGSEVNNNDVSGVFGMIFYLELKQSFNPSSLPGTVGVSGIALTTTTTTETIGNSHTVTVHMTNITGNPVAGVSVSFKIDSGPNQGLTGTGVTNANGEATFSWQSTTAGIDTVTASAISPTDHTSTVTSSTNVTWVASQVTVTAAPVVTVTPTPTATPTPTPTPSPTPAPSIFAGSMLWIIIIIIIIIVVIIIIVLVMRGRKTVNQTTVNVNYQAPPPPPPPQ